MNQSPYGVVGDFEQRVAEWCGAPFGVAVESGTAAIFLSLQHFMKHLPHPSINSYRYDLYPECASYVGKPELGDWQPGNFVLHVPGLAVERRKEILSQTKITE